MPPFPASFELGPPRPRTGAPASAPASALPGADADTDDFETAAVALAEEGERASGFGATIARAEQAVSLATEAAAANAQLTAEAAALAADAAPETADRRFRGVVQSLTAAPPAAQPAADPATENDAPGGLDPTPPPAARAATLGALGLGHLTDVRHSARRARARRLGDQAGQALNDLATGAGASANPATRRNLERSARDLIAGLGASGVLGAEEAAALETRVRESVTRTAARRQVQRDPAGMAGVLETAVLDLPADEKAALQAELAPRQAAARRERVRAEHAATAGAARALDQERSAATTDLLTRFASGALSHTDLADARLARNAPPAATARAFEAALARPAPGEGDTAEDDTVDDPAAVHAITAGLTAGHDQSHAIIAGLGAGNVTPATAQRLMARNAARATPAASTPRAAAHAGLRARIAASASRSLGRPGGTTLGVLEHRLLAAQAALDAALDAGTPIHEAIASVAGAHTIRPDPAALPRPRFVRTAVADGPLDPAALRQARLSATQAFAAGHITPAAWREELARVRAHEGAAAEAADGPVERPSGEAGTGAPKAPDKPADATPRAGATTATDPNLAIAVASLAQRTRPTAPPADGDDIAAVYAAAEQARVVQTDTVEAVGTVIDALPEEARDALAVSVDETRETPEGPLSPADTSETELAQLVVPVPPPPLPGAAPLPLPSVKIPTWEELRERALPLAGRHVIADAILALDALSAMINQNDDDEEEEDETQETQGGPVISRESAQQDAPPPRPNPPLDPPLRTENDKTEGSEDPTVAFTDEMINNLVTRALEEDDQILGRLAIQNRDELREIIETTIKNPDEVRFLPDWRTIFIKFHNENEAIVVHTDPSDDFSGGIVFLSEKTSSDEEPKPAREMKFSEIDLLLEDPDLFPEQQEILQAEHAFDEHGSELSQHLGLKTPEEIREFIRFVRKEAHMSWDLDRGRTVYVIFYNRHGQIDTSGSEGVVVIDDFRTVDYGGTALYTKNVMRYLGTLE